MGNNRQSSSNLRQPCLTCAGKRNFCNCAMS
jgi:hypothetical protein